MELINELTKPTKAALQVEEIAKGLRELEEKENAVHNS